MKILLHELYLRPNFESIYKQKIRNLYLYNVSEWVLVYILLNIQWDKKITHSSKNNEKIKTIAITVTQRMAYLTQYEKKISFDKAYK